MIETNKIYLGDSFVLDEGIPNKSIDMILEDMPYNITACKWDCKIDLEKYWKSRKRIIKDNGAIVLTASQPFTSMLIMSNLKMFKYEWIWDKKRCTGFQTAKIMPMKVHENILLFYNKNSVYNFQKRKVKKPFGKIVQQYSKVYNGLNICNHGVGYPKTIIEFCSPSNLVDTKCILHPTQKPIALFEYLIKTYTNENDLVFDGFAGSGTTGVACLNTNRRFICIEKELEFFKIAEKRIKAEQAKLTLPLAV